MVQEEEGPSFVIPLDVAHRLGLRYDFVAGWLTLSVVSSLAAVGLTAAVSTALASGGISCNMIAGNHHDHLLVPVEMVGAALDVLEKLAGGK